MLSHDGQTGDNKHFPGSHFLLDSNSIYVDYFITLRTNYSYTYMYKNLIYVYSFAWPKISKFLEK